MALNSLWNRSRRNTLWPARDTQARQGCGCDVETVRRDAYKAGVEAGRRAGMAEMCRYLDRINAAMGDAAVAARIRNQQIADMPTSPHRGDR